MGRRVRLGPGNGLLDVLPALHRVIGGLAFALFLFLQESQIHGSFPLCLPNGFPEHLDSTLLAFFGGQSLLAGQHVLVRKPGKLDARGRLAANAPALAIHVAALQAVDVAENVQRSMRSGETKNRLGLQPMPIRRRGFPLRFGATPLRA
jgi:hypothetical protein